MFIYKDLKRQSLILLCSWRGFPKTMHALCLLQNHIIINIAQSVAGDVFPIAYNLFAYFKIMQYGI